MLFNLHFSIWYLLFWISGMISIIGGVDSIDLYHSLKLLFGYFYQNNQSRTPDALLGINFVKCTRIYFLKFVDHSVVIRNFVYFLVILKSTLEECDESETFVTDRINELLDDFNKISIQSNYTDSPSSYNAIGEFSKF